MERNEKGSGLAGRAAGSTRVVKILARSKGISVCAGDAKRGHVIMMMLMGDALPPS